MAAKKRSIKATHTKQVLLETAMTVFIEKGFDKITMRDIASKAGMALGAVYYYFESKEAIVMEYYKNNMDLVPLQAASIAGQTKQFQERFKRFVLTQFESTRHFKKVLIVLAANSTNPLHPLSLFSENTKPIRETIMAAMKELLHESDFGTTDELTPHLPFLFWLYHMGLLFYWIYDDSPGEQKTERLLTQSLNMVLSFLRLSRNPLLRSLKKSLLSFLNEFLVMEKGH